PPAPSSARVRRGRCRVRPPPHRAPLFPYTTLFRSIWAPPAVGALLVAYATYLVYPVAYGEFLTAVPWIVVVEALRNVALVALLVGAVWRVVQLGRSAPHPADDATRSVA